MNRTQSDLNQKIEIVNEKTMSTDSNIAALKKDVSSSKAAVEGLRKSQADAGADLTELREQMQQLRGQVESLRKEMGGAAGRGGGHDENKEKLDQLSQRVNFLETFLAIGEKNAPATSGIGNKVKEQPKTKTTRDDQYAAAYASFKEGKYEKARTEFQNFLKTYPKTSYSDNALFWIGETYYFEKKYDKAILDPITDIDDEAVWGIVGVKEAERKRVESQRFGNSQVLRYIESLKQENKTEFTPSK